MATIIRDTRPTATKKALSEWSDQTNYTIDKLKHLLSECKFNREYDITDEFALYLQKEVFKHFESVDTDEEVKAFMVQYMTEHPSSKYEHQTEEQKKSAEVRAKLDTMLDKILADMKTRDEVKASDYPEWSEELRSDIKAQWGGWELYDSDGNWSWGKAFNRFFTYWYCEPNQQFKEFHCFAYQTKEDVLFTRKSYTFDNVNKCYSFEKNNNTSSAAQLQKSGKSGCLGIIIAIIAIASLIFCI